MDKDHWNTHHARHICDYCSNFPLHLRMRAPEDDFGRLAAHANMNKHLRHVWSQLVNLVAQVLSHMVCSAD
eukprot:CAMPEP_0178425166 /NCGR_PEP_ID=MMETSP0689_2-20121128/28583_1 /TAXON_ID=160604 /ORGANISM="Amphidinium massartii, Strain CS-259" /LENGTH=70 /DNA_ID=CAMNT_0020046821 /DNA_START=113 /DNA_END=325 /DNA_ORIENTATION=+